MARFKKILPFLLGIVLFASCINFSSAARSRSRNRNDEDDNGSGDSGGSAINEKDWANKECTVVNANAPKYYLYMRGFWLGRFVSYKRFRKPDKSTRWVITPVKMNGATFFEMKNVDGKTYIAPRGKKNAAGNFDKFSKSNNVESLWIFDPPRQGVKMSIKSSSKKKFLNQPKKSNSKRVVLSKTKRTSWIIKCD